MTSPAVEQSQKTEPILEVKDTSVSFDMDRGASKVLKDATITLRRDEILGVVGESGSGKSMFASALLNAVVNPGQVTGEIIYHPNDGESYDILDLDKQELKEFRWEEVSMVFQGALSSFNPTMHIRTHFTETLDAHDADVESGLERARELLSDLHMDPERVLDSYPHELSGGMKQRALIALSLILDPNVLVMDEPTAALDLLMQRSILNLLYDLQEKYDIALVFITHDLPLVARLADRLAVMYAFEFAEVGPTEDVVRNAAHPYTRSLLKSTPNLRTPIEEMRPISGSAPDPVNPPSGCSYHPRCPLADGDCEAVDPDRTFVGDYHAVACHNWEQTAEELPFSWEESE